jgi:predicted transcriptional regulator of viral defense system
LLGALERIGNGAAFKRLGYLIERLGVDAPHAIEVCRRHISTGVSDLDPAMPARGKRAARWSLRINAELES